MNILLVVLCILIIAFGFVVGLTQMTMPYRPYWINTTLAALVIAIILTVIAVAV